MTTEAAALLISAVSLLLAGLSLGWQIAQWLLSAGRPKPFSCMRSGKERARTTARSRPDRTRSGRHPGHLTAELRCQSSGRRSTVGAE
ncbi:exported hypothetical protein [Nostocoides jenkinsii Ben 74]|uniref:Uncharacterized protein n=1 Tax=Nostocoides jenkinsii Ben 74 TaxID=1193518 RepID=A0A077MFR3_9MICO|nr:exported hypothetical protein [Tetrasphaera jenkinsii Ben 74]